MVSLPRRTHLAGLFLTLLALLVGTTILVGAGAFWLIREDARAFAGRSAEERVSRVFEKVKEDGSPYRSEAYLFFQMLEGPSRPALNMPPMALSPGDAPAPVRDGEPVNAVGEPATGTQEAERLYMLDPVDGGPPEWWPYSVSGTSHPIQDNYVELRATTVQMTAAEPRLIRSEYVGAERVWPGSGARLVVFQKVETIGPLHRRVAGLTGIVLLGLIFLSGLAVLLAQRRFWRRVQQINTVCNDIAVKGELGRRVPDSEGDALGLVGQNINRMLREIEDRSRLIATQDHFLAHDYRLPIANIIASCNNLLETARDEEANGLRRILALARQMDQSSHERLELYRFDRDLQQGDKSSLEKLDLREIAEEAADGNWVDAEAREIEVVVEGPSGVFTMGSRSLVLRALGNLTRNAIQHSAQGLRVDVRVTAEGGPAVEIRDRGEGMSEADIAAVTGPNEGIRSTSGGFGLGLALVRGVAKAHRGEFTLANASPGLVARLKFVPLA